MEGEETGGTASIYRAGPVEIALLVWFVFLTLGPIDPWSIMLGRCLDKCMVGSVELGRTGERTSVVTGGVVEGTLGSGRQIIVLD